MKDERKPRLVKGRLVDKNDKPVNYEMGKPDPVKTAHYTSFSGVDVQFYARPLGGEWKEMGLVQGVSWKSLGGWSTSEDGIEYRDVLMDMLMLYVVDHVPPPASGEFRLKGCNEYGRGLEILFSGFSGHPEARSGISIDDITTDISYLFKGGRAVVKYLKGLGEKKDA